MRNAFTLSIILSVGLVGVALAQDRGTKAEQDACTPDVFRLCSAYIPSEPSIVACLQSNKRNLSQGCYNVFFPKRAMSNLDMTPTGSIGPAHVQPAKAHMRKAARPHRHAALVRRASRPKR